MSLTERARDFLSRRMGAYQRTFTGPDAEIVLRDLAKFCRAGQTVFDRDQRVNDLLAGRQEVWLRISQHLKMPEDRLYRLLGGPNNE